MREGFRLLVRQEKYFIDVYVPIHVFSGYLSNIWFTFSGLFLVHEKTPVKRAVFNSSFWTVPALG